MESERRDGWTGYDRAAGLVAALLAAGYVVQPIQEVVVAAFSAVLVPLSVVLPFSVLMVLLAGTNGIYTAFLQVRLRNQDRIDGLQERMETLQERVESAGGTDDEAPDELDDVRHELTRTWAALLKQNLRPMVWSMLVTIPAFLWLRWVFVAPAAGFAPAAVFVPLLGQVPWTATVVGPVKLWLAWYFGASISTGFVARRVVGRVAGR